jgi:hypothetical protein
MTCGNWTTLRNAAGLKNPDSRRENSQNRSTTPAKSISVSGRTYSMSNAPICSLRMRRCLMRKRFASRRDFLVARALDAVNNDVMQRWTT